jgi:hypothetical protein
MRWQTLAGGRPWLPGRPETPQGQAGHGRPGARRRPLRRSSVDEVVADRGGGGIVEDAGQPVATRYSRVIASRFFRPSRSRRCSAYSRFLPGEPAARPMEGSTGLGPAVTRSHRAGRTRGRNKIRICKDLRSQPRIGAKRREGIFYVQPERHAGYFLLNRDGMIAAPPGQLASKNSPKSTAGNPGRSGNQAVSTRSGRMTTTYGEPGHLDSRVSSL